MSLGCLVAAGLVGSGPAPPAAAQPAEPTFTVEPAELSGWQGQVDITWSDVPLSGSMAIGECSAVTLAVPDALANCRLVTFVSESSGQITSPVYATFTAASGRRVDCSVEPGGCIVAIGSYSPARTDAWVPLSFPPPVGVTLTPAGPVPPGQTLQVAMTGMEPGASYQLRRCSNDAISPDLCEVGAAAPPVVAGPDGAATASVAAAPVILRATSGLATCDVQPCRVAVLPAAGTEIAGSATYTVVPATVTLTPDSGLTRGQAISVSLTGLAPGGAYRLQHCQFAGSSWSSDVCEIDAAAPRVVGGADGTATATVTPVPDITTRYGSQVTCRMERQCAVGVLTEGTEVVVASAPYTMANTPVTVTPAAGLVDGQEVAVDLGGLEPGAAYHVRLCVRAGLEGSYLEGLCESRDDDPAVVAGPDGTAHASIAVAQRVTSDYYGSGPTCRPDACAVGVVDDASGFVTGWATYAMAEGSVSATPDTGLADGQVVTLEGTGIMASYDGPVWWIFPTGGWGVGQCAADVAADLSIVGVFRRCAVAPIPAPLTVTGSTFSTDVTVRARIDTILGEAVDCTTGPGACVLAIARIEADGSVSLHSTPVDLTPSP